MLPFYIANLLFCSTNLYEVYFNGDGYFGITQSEVVTLSNEDWAEIRTCEWNNSEAPAEMRRITVNFLNFALDYFYGLKDYKNIDSFGEDVITGELRANLLSADAATHNQAYIDLFQKTLNEMHTSLIKPSFFAGADANFDLSGDNMGTAMSDYYSLYYELSGDMSNSLGIPIESSDGSTILSVPLVRFEDNTAFVILNSFTVGTNDQIYNEDGTVSDDARQYDTYYFMQYAMQRIEQYAQENDIIIDNVVLDFTLNGGGSLAAMINTLGFLTNDPVQYVTGNLLSGQTSIEYYNIDTDDDSDYADADAYDMYDWFVLTSPLTFSAANLFAAIVQDMDIATVIGEQSGGGTCSVFTLVLPDGTTTNISGSSAVFQRLNYEQEVAVGGALIESGITPDIVLDSQYFYGNQAIINAISDWKQQG